MISKTQLRDYEVSIWTLQDSFITVLKASNLEQRGEIEDPQMILKDDGENTLSFKIPMYLYDGENFVENPIWYNTINGIVVASLRKIKVIFNKHTEDEAIYEFIITNVVESHEGYQKYCDVSCESLAFHELGKQGYKITLSGDEYNLDLKKWNESGSTTNKPINNLNYWANKVFEDTNWEYVVQMDWSAYGGNRETTKVYEDNEEIEKYRNVEVKESNRYNLSQNIAEAFQVFCRYKYEHDDTYHIVGRKVIFYNNFIKEKEGIIDLTYKYNTQQLKRTMDGTDLVTKMFVRPLKDTDMPSGEVSIVDTNYNQGLEDYILNFDYLYSIGTITQEQYNEILPYKNSLSTLNIDLISLEEQLIELENEKIEKTSKLETAKEKAALDLENVSTHNNLIAALGNDGIISLEPSNAEILTLIKEENKNEYYAHLRKKGIIADSIKIYKTYNPVTGELSTVVNNFTVENDTSGNPSLIKNLPSNTNNIVYAIFNYSIVTGYEKVRDEYQNSANKNQKLAAKLDDELNNPTTGIIKKIEDIKEDIEDKNNEKKVLINNFEKVMGAALREGFWQPEDEYANYYDNYEENFNSIASDFSENDIVSFAWDDNLFDDEQNIYYYFGPSLEKRYYPIIRLDNDSFWKNSDLVFTYVLPGVEIKEGENPSYNYQDLGYMYLNSQMQLCYIKYKNNNTYEYFPALILLGAESATDEDLTRILKQGRIIRINENGIRISEKGLVYTGTGKTYPQWLIKPIAENNNDLSMLQGPSNEDDVKIVYPRFRINSNKVKSPYTSIYIKKSSNILKNYEDFYILYKNSKWYITLKPETIISNGQQYKINFNISSAAKAIYFDALQILKENSCPKVSYEIELSSLNKDFTHTAYNRLGQIAHINDAEFKFENTMGYISEVDLDLAQPWKDKVVIKNYKTKFEDLFSTIVAQTEQMKKNSYIFGAVSNAFGANGMLSGYLVDDIYSRFPYKNQRVISPAEAYAQYEPIIRQQLKISWEEAGEILAAATSSVNDINNVIIKSGDILAGFKENIAAKLTPNSFVDDDSINKQRSKNSQLIEKFKVGDIWVHDGSTYMATENSSQLTYDSEENKYTSLKGWSRIKDGRLAAITGASLNVDAEAGDITIKANQTLNLLCNGLIDISGNKVTITGNQEVEIGGPNIKIYSAGTAGTIDTSKGIHIYTTGLKELSATNAIDITGNGIEMAAANGITFKSGGGLSFSTSDGTNTSAISIDKDTGIYLGSNAPLIFYSGDITESIVNNKKTFTGSGAAVKLTKDRILFGVTNGQNGSAVDLTKDYIVFGSSFVNSNYLNNAPSSDGPEIGSKNGSAGVKISKNYIGLATGTATKNGNNYTYDNRNYIEMSSSGIKIANADQESNGAIVTVNKNGVLIGTAPANNLSGDDLVNYCKSKMNVTPNNYLGATFQVYAPNFVVDKNGHLYAYNADISGNIVANSFILGTNASIPENKIEGLSNKLNGLRNDIDATNAISAVISYAKSSSGVLNNNNLPSDITTWNSAPVTTDDNKPFLWTKTVTTYASGNTSTSYSISYKGRNGTNGKYVTNITPLYLLSSTTTTPAKPDEEVTSSHSVGGWTTSIPTYTNNYYYFRCEQYKWDDNNFNCSTPYIDYGITYAASTATSASTEATSAATTVEPFTYDGLSYGTTWGGKTYGVTLSNSSTAKPMLIGSNSGITIAKSATSSDGAALAIDSSGIALYGKTIHLKTSSNNTTDVVTLDDQGITIGTDGKIEVGSSNFVVTNTTTNGDVAFRLGSSSNPYLKYTVGTGLEVKGSIIATAGNIGGAGGWKIQNGELLGGTLNISNGVISGTGIRLCTTSTTSVIYFYKDNVARMIFSPYTTYTDSTNVTREGNMITINREYKDTHNNILYEPCFTFHRTNGLTIKGNITATDGTFTGTVNTNNGTIGGWNIKSNILYSPGYGDYNNGWPGTANATGLWLYSGNTSDPYSEIKIHSNGTQTMYLISLSSSELSTTGDGGYMFGIGEAATYNETGASKTLSGLRYYYRRENQASKKHGWLELSGTVMINGHRLYFSNSSTPDKYAVEDDIYLFSTARTGNNTLDSNKWEEVKVYHRKTW